MDVPEGRLDTPCWSNRSPGTRRATLAVTLVAAVLVLGVPVGRAELVGDPELLELVATAHQANRERIRTWRGRLRVQSRLAFPDDADLDLPSSHRQASVEFVVDRQGHLARSNWTTQESIETKNGSQKPGPMHVTNTMVKDGAFYECRYDAKLERDSEEPIMRVAQINSASARSPSAYEDDFDPMFWLGYSGKDVCRLFREYYKWAREGKQFFPATLTREGNLVTLEVRSEAVVNRYTVDVRRGGNLVAYDNTNEDTEGSVYGVRWRYDYQNVAGVWLPKKITVRNTQKSGLTVVRELEWIENVVNEPVAKEEFSLVGLGLQRGDRVQDNRIGAFYRVQGDEYPPPDAYRAKRPDSMRTTWSRARVLMIVATVLIGILLLGLLFRRRGRLR